VNGLSVIQKGLEPGQQIVTDGQANLVTGSKIRIKTAADAEDEDQNAAPSSTQSSDSPPRRKRNPPSQAEGNL
jgi:membrane fusion protein, multidrug efflux system